MQYLDQTKIEEIFSMKQFIDAIDQAYALYDEGAFQLPTRSQIDHDGNTLVLMPCIIDKYMVTKLVTVFPENSQKNLPTIHGTVTINCNETGETLAVLDGGYITAARTGAIGGNAMRHLAKQDVKTLAVVGAGVQGFYQTIAACEEKNFEKIYIFNRTQGEKLEKFVQSLRENLPSEIEIIGTDNIKEAVKNAEVIITATTSKEPVLPNDADMLKNKLIIGIGSFQPTMQEIPEAAYEEISHIYYDTKDAIEESGDLINPLENKWTSAEKMAPLSQLIADAPFDIEKHEESIFFKSTGSALFDAVVAAAIYEAGKK